MPAPFYKFGLFGEEMSLIVAFLIGIAFGFILERAGFGNARVLAAQFYFKELRVLKVMFTAIITAMVGLTLLSAAGFVDLSLVYLTSTYIWPQIIGGILLGIGFVIGGYCPGTSCVSAATGRIDGIVYLGGIIVGLFAYGEIYPSIADFAHSTPLGKLTLPELLHIPYGFLVLAVVVMAIIAFVAAEWAEGRFGGRRPDLDSLLAPARRFAPSRKLAGALLGLGVIAALAGNPYRGVEGRIDTRTLALEAANPADQLAVRDLADRLVQGRNDLLIVDVRDADAYATYRIPGAINVPLASLTADFVPRNERILFYSDSELQAAQAWLLMRSLGYDHSYLLRGGLDAWKQEVLFPAPASENPTPEQTADFAARAAVAKFFGGTPRADAASGGDGMPQLLAPPPPTEVPVLATRKKKKKEGC
ncbi:YeeE/YedE thiosulfate transporter family protein [Actomonas aquatica]|uniref:YeeE/YedE thiosulfate transporter family protein n=1 Tax=Actomonas aquatica TaxID=2866162 RepID=A0ABZ1C4N1_9BACT|nr:YeeE/YedE thiosulfate transporter family protein [Opitutus sp. WL0086]WRQ86317.1 YeeE/YedE thiosulfate transporter family protein [Opitutus sp. WL0086]